jgi:hypothetical protein
MVGRKARILVACDPHAYARLFAVLTGQELILTTTRPDADAALKGDGFDLVMIGVHFDESRMFDFLRHVRADDRYARVPVACFRGVVVPEAQARLGMDAVGTASRAMGADAFFDMVTFADDAPGNAAVRKIVEGLLAGERGGR